MTLLDEFMADTQPWPRKGRGGFMRNQYDQVVVSHPDGGKRTLIYDGASDLLSFGRPYTGDPIHGERGTFVHDLCELADRYAPMDDAFLDRGEQLGISAGLATYIYHGWRTTRAAHGITTVAIEQPVVHDGWRVATNADRIDGMHGERFGEGARVLKCWGADIKTSTDPVRLAYAVQLAVVPGSVQYDPDTGERTPWPYKIDPNVGHIWWFPIGKAIAADSEADWPRWQLIRVDLRHAHAVGNELAAIKYDPVRRDDFTFVAVPDFAAPSSTSPAEVEPPSPEAAAGPASPAAAPVALTPAEQHAAIPADLDEGADFDDPALFARLEERYAKLDQGARAALGSLVVEATQAGVSFHAKGHHTQRRFDILRGLIMLAEADGLDPDAVRGIVAQEDGYADCAWFPSVKVGHLVGSLGGDAAERFATRCSEVAQPW